MKTIISSQRTSLSFDYENQRKLMKEERFAGKQNSAGEMGHRIAKHSYDKDQAYNNGLGQLVKSTYYVLDGQGNTIATYERAVDENTLQISYAQTEKFIYGSSRLGVQNCNIALLGSQNNTYTQTTVPHRIGKKGYELSNHLGNVLSVISDKAIPQDNGSTVDYWLADILQSTDYSPFGVQLNNRTLRKSGVTDFTRFGFQNQEEDSETGLVNYKYRMHDPRMGRFFCIDPLTGSFPWNSSYAFSENRVIQGIELEGLEVFFTSSGVFLGMIGNKDNREIRIVQAHNVVAVMNYIQDAKGLTESSECFHNDQKNAINKSYLWSEGTKEEKGAVSKAIFKIWIDYSIEEISLICKHNPNYIGATKNRSTFYVSDLYEANNINNNLFNQICLWEHEKTHAENMISPNEICKLGYSFHHFDCVRAQTSIWAFNYVTEDYKLNMKNNALNFLAAELIDIKNQTNKAVKAKMQKQFNSDLKYFTKIFNVSDEELKNLNGNGAEDSGKTLNESK